MFAVTQAFKFVHNNSCVIYSPTSHNNLKTKCERQPEMTIRHIYMVSTYIGKVTERMNLPRALLMLVTVLQGRHRSCNKAAQVFKKLLVKTCQNVQKYALRTHSNCWETLKPQTLQHKNEIYLSVKVKKFKDSMGNQQPSPEQGKVQRLFSCRVMFS